MYMRILPCKGSTIFVYLKGNDRIFFAKVTYFLASTLPSH